MTAQPVWTAQENLRRAEQELSDLARELDAAGRTNPGPGSSNWMNSPTYRAAATEVDRQRTEVTRLQTELGGVVYRVPGQNLGALLTKLEALNKRARRNKLDELKVTQHETEVIRNERPWDPELAARTPSVSVWTYVSVAGGQVKIAGWILLASLSIEEGGVMVSKVPAFARAWALAREGHGSEPELDAGSNWTGEAVDQAKEELDALDLATYRDPKTATRCDHCGTSRRRTITYLVQSVETGEIKQVGANCLRDFLGTDPHRIAKYAEWLVEVEALMGESEDEEWSGRSREMLLSEDFLMHVSTMIRTEGWHPRSGGGSPTADAARRNYYAWRGQERDKQGRQCWIDPTEADLERAKAAIEWARTTLVETARGDFEQNMVVAAKGEFVPKKGDGVLAYVPVAHAKFLEREIEVARQAKAGENSDHFGTVGERVVLKLKVERVWERESDYGVTFITKLSDEAGNLFKWFGSYELEQGSVVEAKWTIKDHGEYKGVKETTINRPSGLEVVEDAAGDEPAGLPDEIACVPECGQKMTLRNKNRAGNQWYECDCGRVSAVVDLAVA